MGDSRGSMKPRPGVMAEFERLTRERDEARAEVERLRRERSEARGLARVLAHAYQTDSRPPRRVVAEALAYPVRS